jgi:hypothetical protein
MEANMPKLKVSTSEGHKVTQVNIIPNLSPEGRTWDLKIHSDGQAPQKFAFDEEQLRELATKINRIFNL